MRRCRMKHFPWLTLLAISVCLGSIPLDAQAPKNRAQQLVDATMKKHPEISGLELSATPTGQTTCVTIAATEQKDIGEKCDEDETAALTTGKPFVEHEPDGYDVTAPLHDAKGNLIGTLGIDIKPVPGQKKKDALKITTELLKELEPQISSAAFLFEPGS